MIKLDITFNRRQKLKYQCLWLNDNDFMKFLKEDT